jgi:hypothetical protein
VGGRLGRLGQVRRLDRDELHLALDLADDTLAAAVVVGVAHDGAV